MEDKCAICLYDYNDTNSYSLKECKHKFHIECYISWCKISNGLCPLCKAHDSKYSIGGELSIPGTISFLRKAALRKDSPNTLKILAKNLRNSEKEYNDYNKEYKEFKKINKDIFKKNKEMQKNKWRLRSKVCKSRQKLLGFPVFFLPEHLRINYS